ncbi:DUF2268 domain-containing protein [Guptibacillus hwajinpoensis]|uniref:DUF2268 domain-containing protein n=1 Tax=Guptibacillus hwajinpoensis TaxID=208199 RepID=UPI001CFE9CB4|nr:DUF2268 domain-containing putative Zn-dependent protease [Pseudalkalibacillus hwajinpoensis]WLR59057.1 DUF2268 domain-containing putative Zn-dependent protease [Pseudalkalibacillus hwajinpoensis]
MGTLIKKLAICIALIVIVGCSNNGGETPSQSSMEFEVGGQSFKIIPLYEEVLDYTNEAMENTELNTSGEYYSKVTQPFLESASHEEASLTGGLDYSTYFSPTSSVQTLNEQTVELLKKQEEVNKAIKASLTKSGKSLEGENKTIYVMPVNPDYKNIQNEMKGVSAITVSKDVIVLFLSPTYEKEMLEYAVAHEYHHTVFLENPNRAGGMNLLNGFVFEGKADSFASQLYPEANPPWSEPLSAEEEKRVLEALREKSDSTNAELYSTFQNGDLKKDIPKWSNYKLGFKIVESYLRHHPEATMKEWTMMNEREMIRGSDYNELISE